MALRVPTPLLGGLSPAGFMRRHWQKKPLRVRGALDPSAFGASPGEIFALAAQDGVESRLVERAADGRWKLRHGPFARRALPPLARPGWTLLVQGVDLHLEAAHRLLRRFRFIPGVRLDDLMVSYASAGGGVGPHVDSYDVFLLQVAGQRRWRIGADARAKQLPLRDDVPLRMLAQFEPADEWLLEPGDMLYLPPGWAHDGVAEGSGCMTASIGFRSPSADDLASALLERVADGLQDAPRKGRNDGARAGSGTLYRDAGQAATETPAAVPPALQRFAGRSVAQALADPRRLERALGEWLCEPKAQVVFEPASPRDCAARLKQGVRLDRRTRMAYDPRHVYINGESYRASGVDARLMRTLADERRLAVAAVKHASAAARDLLTEWRDAGWLHPSADNQEDADDTAT